MSPTDASQNPSTDPPPALLRPMKAMAVVGPIMFALMWMGFGLFAFFQIQAWGVAFDRKMAMIERGEVKPDTLSVTGLSEDKKHGGWNIAMGKEAKAVAWRTTNDVEEIRVGSTVAAYRFDDAYLIPRFDRGGHEWGKWVFLAIGFLPLPVIGLVLLVKVLRGRPQPPEGGPIPKAFSLRSMSFDGVPADSQLVCLLGDRDSGPLKAVEEGESLVVRPWLFPMRFIAPWMVLTMAAITVMLFFLYGKFDVFAWLFLAIGWFVCLPGFLGLLTVMNRSFAQKGDYFKVDMARRTLEVCRLGVTVKASDIIAITLLTRWYRIAGEWAETFQTGVLVRARDQQIELYPLVRIARRAGHSIPSSMKSEWAIRLAGIFQVPIRRIELSKSESLALNDC